MDNRGEDRKDFAGRRSFRNDEGGRGERRGDDGNFRPRRFDREDGERRDFRKDGFRPRDGRGSRDRALGTIMDIDGDIMHLVMRRAQMVARLRRSGKLAPETEKKLRTAWEDKAARLGRDTRISRDLFVLLQTIEPLSKVEEEQAYYNLSPRTEPVEISIPAPSDTVASRLWLSVAAASGQVSTLKRVPLTDDVVSCIKSLNTLGGQLWWEDNGDVQHRGGTGFPRNLDKVIHVGGSELNLWLAIAFCAGMPCRLKITGDGALRTLDLGSVRRFLPQLGIRMTNVIPAQDGLPVRIECSGMLPDAIELPEDLPADFRAALLLASPFWESECRLSFPGKAPVLLSAVEGILTACGLEVRHEGDSVYAVKGALQVPETPSVAMDASVAASILMLPGFNGGRAELEGLWGTGRAQALAEKMLRGAGLNVNYGKGSVVCTGKERETAAPAPEIMAGILAEAPELLPLACVIMAAAVLEGTKASLPDTLDGEDRHTATVFLSRCGIEESDGELVKSERDVTGSWVAPSAQWAMAFALSAFLRPNQHLSNPGVLSGLFPSFWNMYNTLPRPELSRRRAAQETEDAKPARRRVIAHGVYGELPPEPASDED
ncbi:MAG: hypothetical protein MJ061_00240 [Mailhella sp.]|nr:hypothetical protein [Mailhella sp.]